MNESLAQSQEMLRAFLQAELQLVPHLIGTAHGFFCIGDREVAFQSMHRSDEALGVVERFAVELPAAGRSAILQSAAELRASMRLVQRLASQ